MKTNDDYDMNLVWDADEDIRSLKSLILFGIRGMAAYAYHAGVLGYYDERVNKFIAKALLPNNINITLRPKSNNEKQ